MKLTFHGGPYDEKEYDSPTTPDRFDWPFWEVDKQGLFCQGVDRYLRRGKTKHFDYLERRNAIALPEVEDRKVLTKAQLHRLKCRIARDKARADKIAMRLGIPTVEAKEKLDAISAADKAIADLKAQMEELDRLVKK